MVIDWCKFIIFLLLHQAKAKKKNQTTISNKHNWKVCSSSQIIAPCVVNGRVDVCSSRKSASRLTCRIASRSITTRAPRSVTTVAACCGVFTDKASSVKVSRMRSLFQQWRISCVASASVILTFFFLLIVPFLFTWPTLWPDCGMNVHSNCQKKVANLCGINQKLLAEALSQVSQVCTVPCYINFSKKTRCVIVVHYQDCFSKAVSFFIFFFFFLEIYQEVWWLEYSRYRDLPRRP